MAPSHAAAEGMTLRSLIDAEAPLRPARAVQMVLQILEHLETLHRGGHVHGDVRPELVIVRNGRVDLAPASGQPGRDLRADVRGAAGILYELLTRSEPRSDTPVSRCTPAVLPAKLDDVVERALDSSHAEAFATVAPFAHELRVCLLDALGNARKLRAPERF